MPNTSVLSINKFFDECGYICNRVANQINECNLKVKHFDEKINHLKECRLLAEALISSTKGYEELLFDNYGFSLAHIAASMRDKRCLEGLWEIRKKLDVTKEDYVTQVFYKGKYEQYVIPFKKFDFNAIDNYGMPASYYAFEGNKETLKTLGGLQKIKNAFTIALQNFQTNNILLNIDIMDKNNQRINFEDVRNLVLDWYFKFNKSNLKIETLFTDVDLYNEYLVLKQSYGLNFAHIFALCGDRQQFIKTAEMNVAIFKNPKLKQELKKSDIFKSDIALDLPSCFSTFISDYTKLINAKDLKKVTAIIKDTRIFKETTFAAEHSYFRGSNVNF